MPRFKLHDSSRWMFASIAATLLLAVLAAFELQRVQAGRLFLLSLPHEAAPSEVEFIDARESAIQNMMPAVAAVIMIGLVIAVAGPTSFSNLRQSRSLTTTILWGFLAAVTADLLTTMWFFHHAGIEHELHPAIRLFGYAYGRTLGPIFGKSVQAFGVLFLAAQAKLYGRWLILLVTSLYAAAAVYNLSQSL